MSNNNYCYTLIDVITESTVVYYDSSFKNEDLIRRIDCDGLYKFKYDKASCTPYLEIYDICEKIMKPVRYGSYILKYNGNLLVIKKELFENLFQKIDLLNRL